MFKTLLAPLALVLGFTACGGPVVEETAPELDSTSAEVLALTTCNEVFTHMGALGSSEPLPVAQVTVIGKFKAASAKVAASVSSSLLGSAGVYHGSFDGNDAVAAVQLRKRFQTIAGRSVQMSSTLRVSFIEERSGRTRLDATVVPTSCVVNANGSATVRALSGTDEITVVFHGEPLPG